MQNENTRALLAVVKAAQRVEYYKHYGRHGDGKDEQAHAELIAAIKHARSLMKGSENA